MQEIIAQALSNNGVESLTDLQEYIEHDVHGQGKRLDQLHGMLKDAREKQLAAKSASREDRVLS